MCETRSPHLMRNRRLAFESMIAADGRPTCTGSRGGGLPPRESARSTAVNIAPRLIRSGFSPIAVTVLAAEWRRSSTGTASVLSRTFASPEIVPECLENRGPDAIYG